MGRPDRGAPVLSGSIIARRPGLSTGGRADRRAGRAFSAVGRWSGFGPAQVQTCNVVPRPVPGGGSRLSLGESPDAKSRGGGPPPPLGLGAAHCRSLVLAWWGAAGRSLGYFVTHVRAPIWELSFAKMLSSIFPLENASQIGLSIPEVIAPRTDQRQRSPKRANESERAINPGVQGAPPPALFLPISREKWGPPPGRRGPPGRCAPRVLPSHPPEGYAASGCPRQGGRVWTSAGPDLRGGSPPDSGRETTSQGLTCAGPNGTTYRRQRTPAGQAPPLAPPRENIAPKD